MPYKFKKIVKYIDFFELIRHNYMQKMEIYVEMTNELRINGCELIVCN